MFSSFVRILGQCIVSLALLLLSAGLLQCAEAQPSEQDGTVSVAGGDILTIGGLLQTDAYLGRTSNNQFRMRTTRLSFGGEANDLRYVVQTDFATSPVLLDAFARLPLTNQVSVTAGLFKTPFSAEFLTPRSDLLFAERARVVDAIAPNRQVGVAVASPLLPDRLNAIVGVFNGTRGLRPNDNDLLLYVGRLDGRVDVGVGELEIGTNLGYSIDDAANLPGLNRPSFTGSRLVYGVDAQLETDRWLLAGELDGARLDPQARAPATPFGYYLTAGAIVQDDHQVLVRFDTFDPDVPILPAPESQLTFGYNYEPSSLLRILLNYKAPVDDLNGGFLTARLQVALR